MTREEDEKIERFRSVVCDQLQGELSKIEKDRQQIVTELQEFASLLVVVRNMQNNKADKINIRTSLGHQVFVNAKLVIMVTTDRIKESAVRSLITIGSRGDRGVLLDANALRLLTALANALVLETLLRAAQYTQLDGRSTVVATDFQRILPSILLDFSM
ncbi:unnamed protein product [Strongylus vulgaris]|uniref:Centromere protein X n=1 Tax=Strongylus vulgaris TaxID=40348 RepID=A0A3P7JYX6_STRVU|nr:unnamed protein product [Strongylus vulgaris]